MREGPLPKLSDFIKDLAQHSETEGQECKEYFRRLLEETIVISFYNNKGGVGKSSAAIEIGTLLAQQGLKVLLVDADSQGNLTSRALHRYFVERGIRVAEQQGLERISEEHLLDMGEEDVRQEAEKDLQRQSDIYEFFDEIIRRPGNLRAMSEAISRAKIYPAPVNKASEGHEDLKVLMGSQKLGRLEQRLASSFTLGAANPALLNMPGSLVMALRCLALAHEARIILIDLNPASAILNQCLFMGSNYYIVPYLAEYSSLRGVKNIEGIIQEWGTQIEGLQLSVSKQMQLGDAGTIDPTGWFPPKPVLLGAICHRVPQFTTGDRTMPLAYQRAHASIMHELTKLLPHRESSSQQNLEQSLVSHVVNEARSTAVAAGMAGVPLCDITREMAEKVRRSEAGEKLKKVQIIERSQKINQQYFIAFAAMASQMTESQKSLIGYAMLFDLRQTMETQGESLKAGRAKISSPHLSFQSPNGLSYTVQRVASDGNCGLSAIGIPRPEFCDVLYHGVLEGTINQRYANYLVSDIREALQDNEFLSPQLMTRYKDLLQDLEKRSTDATRARVTLRDSLPLNLRPLIENMQSVDDFVKIDELNNFVAQSTEAGKTALQALNLWGRFRLQEQGARHNLFNFLASQPVIEAYMTLLRGDGVWVGIHSLYLFALISKRFNLYIHRQDLRLPGGIAEAQPGEFLELRVPPDQPPPEVRRIVYNGTHFDRLVEAEPSEEALQRYPRRLKLHGRQEGGTSLFSPTRKRARMGDHAESTTGSEEVRESLPLTKH